ncbi:MAG: MFS transporter, partial [Burkholderiales bacterium]|nr:MFS transporter [Burkholderiales bacterium]
SINSIGNLGGFVGPAVIGWLKGKTGGYTAGLYVVAATLAISAVLTLMLARRTSGPVALSTVRHEER